MENYLKEVLEKISKDVKEQNKDITERVDTLINLINNINLECGCKKELGTTINRKKLYREGRFTLAGTDGALRVFLGFKRASYSGRHLAASMIKNYKIILPSKMEKKN